MSPPIVSERQGRLARITLNRPEAGNRLTMPSVFQLMKALFESGHSDAHVVVIRAAGQDFCAGLDEPPGSAAFNALTLREQVIEPILSLYGAIGRIQVPVIAAVQGNASGFGCALAAAADIVLAAETATFALPGLERDVPPALEMAALLQAVPPKAVAWLAYSGAALDAETARGLGLASRVVPAAALAAETDAMAAALAARPRATLTGTKQFLRIAGNLDAAGAGELAANTLATVLSSRPK
jgi:enoyl-CoA hydratase/carnithine racemase